MPAMCFDTTNSNTGNNTRACFIVNKSLGGKLMHLVCRHFIMDPDMI